MESTNVSITLEKMGDLVEQHDMIKNGHFQTKVAMTHLMKR